MENNAIQIFNYKEQQVRTVEQNSEVWFVAKDVCDILKIVNSRDAISRLDSDEKGVAKTDTLGGMQDMTIISEPGLYKLAFKSKKSEAKDFTRWVTHEVLPAIRKHGGYLTPTTIEELLDNPDLIVEMALKLKAEREKRVAVERELLAAQPKVEYFDELVERNTLTGIRETAKEFRWKEKDFISFLLNHGYVYRDQKNRLQPYADQVAEGLFVLKES